MAELMLVINPTGQDPKPTDGDCLDAFNNRKIKWMHAQHISHARNMTFTSDGLRPQNCLCRKVQESIYEKKFERISKTEVQVTNLWTNEINIYSDITNPHIYVEEHIKNRMSSDSHTVYGLKGKEFWFGGKTNVSLPKVDLAWTHITNDTGEVSTDSKYELWGAGRKDLKSYLFIKINDFLDSVAEDLLVSETIHFDVSDQHGRKDPQRVKLRNRKKRVIYDSLGLPVDINDIRDRSKTVDIRRDVTLDLDDIVDVKSPMSRVNKLAAIDRYDLSADHKAAARLKV